MTPAWRPGDDPSPEYQYRRIVATPGTYRHRTPISRQLLDDPRYAQYRANLVDEAVEHAVLEVEREVYRAALPSGSQTFPVDVDVPYVVTVSVAIPRGWWARLFRRRQRYVMEDAVGMVRATAHVRVDMSTVFRMPEFAAAHGPLVPTGDATLTPGPARVEVVDTYPAYGPHGTVSSRGYRCSTRDGGCGHHRVTHVPGDLIEPGGCVIDDCDCRRTYGDGPFW